MDTGIQKRQERQSITVGSEAMSLADFTHVIFDGKKVDFDNKGLSRVNQGFEFLREFSKNKVIYGINTGFGPMAQKKINAKDQEELQYNLIRSHSSGTGNALPNQEVKAVMLARLNTLMVGYSGIHECMINALRDMINHGVYPQIFEHGGVGASGDLVQLAHLALCLIGEGESTYKGELMPTKRALSECNLKPAKVHIREGLGVMNGTSAMTGIGLVNLVNAKNLLNWSVAASSLVNEIVECYDDHFSAQLNNAKRHSGQKKIATAMRNAMEGSALVKSREEYLYNRTIRQGTLKDKVQEYYSVRCVPQILGPVLDTLQQNEIVLIDEINSANDNPIIDPETQNVYHGGNFHGDYVALEMDKMKTAVTKVSMLCERQLNYLLNPNLNDKLPPFVNHGTLGLNFGMQGVQFTATSTVAENQTLSNPMYVHSIPCNNDNQDIVSMGANAALMTRTVIDNSFQVLAIEMMTIIQSVEHLNFETSLGVGTRKLFQEIKAVFPSFVKDKPWYPEIKKMTEFLKENRIEIIN